jgi:cytoskeletal protein CcmA (bactofilin family)
VEVEGERKARVGGEVDGEVEVGGEVDVEKKGSSEG